MSLNLKRVNCDDEKKKLKEMKEKIKNQEVLVNNCELENYKYGKEEKTLFELLELIKKENIKNVIDFIELFPYIGVKGINISQQHVFEALWNLIFIFQKDNLKSDNETRKFYKKLETMEKETDNIKKIIKKTKVNESKKSGIADTFFEHIQINGNKCSKCGKIIEEENKHNKECKFVECKINGEIKNIQIPSCNKVQPIKNLSQKFLFSAKYFRKERSINSYDIQNIIVEAEDKLKDFNIILLLKDKEDFDKKVLKTTKNIASRFFDRLDIKDLDLFYKDLLNDLLSNESIEKYIEKFEENKELKILQPRFHQEFFINYSVENIKKEQFKLVWGAVPRSGKSYMIGGLISRLYKEKIRSIKNVIIILGAVSETGPQFKEMFEEYSDFNDFEKISIQEQEGGLENGFSKKYKKINSAKKNIILISQQQLWHNAQNQNDIHPILKKIFKENDTIVFFDEIHQGSSAKANAQIKILNNLIFYNNKINYPFIMVTATFAKPLKKYLTLGGQNSHLIQWRYEDIQYMKEIDNDVVYQKLLNELENTENDNDKIKKTEILKELFENYLKRGITKAHLKKEYLKYPKLNIISPSLEDKSFVNDENKEGVNSLLKSDIENQVICNIFKANNSGFSKPNFVKELLNYIKEEIYNKLLKQRFKINIYGESHTQLWFLPTICSKKNEKDNKVSIERMTRFLSILMMNDDDFRNNFCVLVIHSTMEKSKTKEMNMEPFNRHSKSGAVRKYGDLTVTTYSDSKTNPCISTKCVGDKELGKCIEKQEACAHAQNKSVIILTGMRLRLGISLPCVDIALHMDPISSVDTIYQSMFRVLTERKGKTDGYFIDLLSERFVNFIYEYDNYTNKSKKNIDLQTRKNNIIEKLYSFNLNGINLVDNSKFSKVYTKLSNNLDINNDLNFNKRATNLDESNIINMFSDLETFNKNLFDKFYRGIQIINIDYSKKSKEEKEKFEKEIYRRKKNREVAIYNDNSKKMNDFIENDENEKNSNNTEDSENKYEKMKNYIKDIFTLILIFQQEILGKKFVDCNPYVIKDDLIKALEYDLTEDDINKTLCKKDNKIIDCHISYIKSLKFDKNNISKEEKIQIAFILNLFRHNLLEFIKELNDNDIEELFKYFCTIRESFIFLEKNINNQYNIMHKRCSNLMKGGRKKQKEEKQLIENETVLETIRKYLSVREEEKKLFGEVFTPVELVCEMLDKLPNEVWKDPKLKWLDPANGIGNYPVVAYYKLMEGLKNVKGFENQLVRSKHIIENMLYMVELNPVNVKVCKKIFKNIDSNAEPNIYNSPFYTDVETNLNEVWKNKCSVKSFDIIMGNPPYNSGGTGISGKKNIYVYFSIESMNLLNNNGFLLFIHPSAYRINNHKIKGTQIDLNKIYTSKNILFIKIFNMEETKELFNIQLRVDYILIQNTAKKTKTTILSEEYGKEESYYINKGDFIPSYGFSIIEKLKQKVKEMGKISLYISSENHADKLKNQNNGIYTNIHSITKEGIKTLKSNKIHKQQKTPKIFINGYGESFIYFDKGEFGGTEQQLLYLNPNKFMKKFFKSNIIQFLLKATKVLGNHISRNNITDFIPDFSKTNLNDNSEIYDYFNFTESEKKFLDKENFKTPTFKLNFIDKKDKTKRTIKNSNIKSKNNQHSESKNNNNIRTQKNQNNKSSIQSQIVQNNKKNNSNIKSKKKEFNDTNNNIKTKKDNKISKSANHNNKSQSNKVIKNTIDTAKSIKKRIIKKIKKLDRSKKTNLHLQIIIIIKMKLKVKKFI